MLDSIQNPRSSLDSRGEDLHGVDLSWNTRLTVYHHGMCKETE